MLTAALDFVLLNVGLFLCAACVLWACATVMDRRVIARRGVARAFVTSAGAWVLVIGVVVGLMRVVEGWIP